MRKQTKLVAVLSTAALLALGASMSSFAATGWQEENGTWAYYDKSGDKVTDKWERSGDSWFWINEDGEMSTDYLVEDGDKTYYVDENGAMVSNKWVSIANENAGDENEPENHWYYFGSNGKAYKAASSNTAASWKTINGKKYVFDGDGKMQYGWIDKDGVRITGDEAWTGGIDNGSFYYAGDQNDGAQATGWVTLDIVDKGYTDDSIAVGEASTNVFDDENQTRYFYFKSNGRKLVNKKGETINGKKYSFDNDGRMNAEWVVYDVEAAVKKGATTSIASSSEVVQQGDKNYTEQWRYFGSPENGARVTKGWFKVVPDSYLNTGDYDDDKDAWYYSDNNGKLVASEIKTINGKKYMFNGSGKMESGLKFVNTDGKKVVDIAKDDNDDDGLKYETGDQFKDNAHRLLVDNKVYYFGNGDDGSMKTGKQTVSIDGENFTFLFNKSGGFQGSGKSIVEKDKVYLAGMLLTADKEDKFEFVKGINDNKTEKATLVKVDSFVRENTLTEKELSDAEAKKYSVWYDVKDNGTAFADLKLINTSGTILKAKTKAKAGADYCVDVKNGKVTAIYLEN